MLIAVNLSKSFGSRKVLRGVSLSIAPGEVVSLIGINGAGKTTLLRILAGLSNSDTGAVNIDQCSSRRDPLEYRAGIGVVLHAPMLYGNLTARENLRFFSRVYRVPDAAMGISDLLEKVNLRARADDLVRTYSRGMQQRLAIARALLHDPACLLLDEPFTGLDQDSSLVFEKIMEEAAASRKMVLMATHDLEKACRSGARVDLLHQGRIAFSQSGVDLTIDSLNKAYREITGTVPVKHIEGESA